MLFYMIFGTNLLTYSLVRISVFSLFLSIAEKENQTKSNDLKFHGDYFWTRTSPWSIRDGPEESRCTHDAGGAPYPPGRAPYLVAASETP